MPKNALRGPSAARCETSASSSVRGSAQACPQTIPSPGRITLASSITGWIMADDKMLDVILRNARTHAEFHDKPVPESLIRQAHDLMKWGPTTANSQPGRFV